MIKEILLKPLILNLIYFLPLCLLSLLTFNIVTWAIKTSTDIYRYKIHNRFISWVWILSYIGIFFILLYFLRVYNLGKQLNLKEQYISLLTYYSLITDVSLEYKLYIAFILINIISIFVILLIKLHRVSCEEIYKLYIYYGYKECRHCKDITKEIRFFLFELSYEDIIQYSMWRMTTYYTLKLINKKQKTNKEFYTPEDYIVLPSYHFKKLSDNFFSSIVYRVLFNISPVMIIIYDCVFNDFIITHVYYYLLFYIPIKILKRITFSMATASGYIRDLFWEMYYKKEQCIYAISLKMRPLLDDYILKGLKLNLDIWVDGEMYIYNSCRFIQIQHDAYTLYENLYVNEIGVIIHQDKNGILVQIDEDEDGNPIEGQIWVLLADKTQSLNYEKKKYSA